MVAVKEEKPKGLAAKLSEVMGLMQAIPKEGWNDNQKYKFVRETDVAERVSALLAERHIFIQQTVTGHGIEEHFRTSSGSMMWLSTVTMEFTFIDGDTGETLGPVMFPGQGADTGDKGIYKAMTGAEKYFLMKTFLISTGDDPEADAKVDKAAAAAGAASGTRVTKSNQPGVQRGGKSANATTAQVDEIGRLFKGLAVTRTEDIASIIKTMTGLEPTTNNLREFFSGLTSEQAADIITKLSDFVPVDNPVEEVGTDNNPDVVEAEQESFDIA